MALITVSQLRTLIASIPTSANTWTVDVPDEGVTWPVCATLTTDANGNKQYVVRGYVDLAKRTWTAVP